MKKVEILGVRIDNLTLEEILFNLEKKLCEENFKGYITTPNPEIILMTQKDKELLEIINNSYFVVPDGVGLILASKIIRNHLKNRVPGIDLMIEICKLAERLNKSVCLVGLWKEAIVGAISELKKKFPKLIISNVNKANIIFVGLGTPKQEKWIKKNYNLLPNAKIFLTVGGAFEMIAGIKKRAPKFLRVLGLEWLWRFLLEPRKRFKRIIKAVIIFPFKVLFSEIFRKF